MSQKLASAVFGVFACVLCQAASAADLPVLRIGSDGGLNHLPLVVAQKKGFFAKEGIRVETVKDAIGGPLSNSQAALQGYEPSIERGGRADMAVANGGFLIDAVLNGSDAVAVGTMTANPIYSLVVRPEIKSYADLKGKTITLTAPWDGISLTSRALLAKNGIGAKDFKFEAIKMSDARLECMKQKKCAAISAVQPTDIQAIDLGLGFHRLGTTHEAGPITFYIDVVTRKWAETHKDAIVRYLRAKADAIAWINDPKNRAELTMMIAEITGDPPTIVNQVAASYADPKREILTAKGELNPAWFNNLLVMAKAAGKDAGLWDKPFPPAEKFYDLSYGKAAGIQ
jgi:ABC-type nitrate/sulfonate/bicarbonate transport system substrate-binding protein